MQATASFRNRDSAMGTAVLDPRTEYRVCMSTTSWVRWQGRLVVATGFVLPRTLPVAEGVGPFCRRPRGGAAPHLA
jgi:hypothetical protein